LSRHHRDHRRDHHQHRPPGPSRPWPAHLPNRGEDQQRRSRCGSPHPPRLPRRMELHNPPRADQV